jgi:hypothetical protein
MRLCRVRLAAIAAIFVPLAAYPQTSPEKSSGPTSEQRTAAKPAKKASLADATRVSTDDAARQAIQQQSPDRAAKDSSIAAGESDVVEFKPAPPIAKDDDSVVVRNSGDSKKLKKVHGEAYGAAGAGSHREGGAVGATSKGGKTAVYVETDHSQASPPR